MTFSLEGSCDGDYYLDIIDTFIESVYPDWSQKHHFGDDKTPFGND